jgi:DNA invertase Pin-like site-specific DNA recombinase
MSEKIQPTHRERAAYVYVRQSTMHQVRHHLESQRRQYALEERARQLGFAEVIVIDVDLGRSGSGSTERPGFGTLLAAVCAGRAGAVFALEASRLARNNRDWHHLIDLCALTGTLVVDDDGVYDPQVLNDRLLLGLKGTMSEFELGLLRQRAQEALRQMIARGEVLWEVAIGYQRTPGNGMELTPDLQVQQALRGLFTKFRELGSARQVMLWYHQEQLPLPAQRRGPLGPEIVWQVPGYHQILRVLKNPVYSGALVHGRLQTRVVVQEGRARKTSGHPVPLEDWTVLLRDHHPGYISWEEYLRNQALLESNAPMTQAKGHGAAKTGPALLAGLLRCRRCGRKLHVAYSGKAGRVPRYDCRGGHINHGTQRCLSFGSQRIDRYVSAAVLEALQPAGVAASLAAWEQLQQAEDEKRRSLTLALEKAQYEADLVRRRYEAVDPQNRLVAGELERRWNVALAQVGQLAQRIAQELPAEAALPAAARGRLLELGQDLEALWNHPAASASLKKRLLRTVLEEIVVDIHAEPSELQLWLHWAGGVHTELRVPKNRTGEQEVRTDRELLDVLRDLAKVSPDRASAAILNRLGYRTATGLTWTETRVRVVRQRYGIPAVLPGAQREWVTLEEAAVALGVSPNTARKLIERGILPARQAVRHAPWIIQRKDLELPAVRSAATAVRKGRELPAIRAGESLELDLE